MAEKYRKIYWTDHSKMKMRQYGLSKSKILNLLYKPERKEQGIATGTMAVMQTKKVYGNLKKPVLNSRTVKKAPGEIWMMYRDDEDTRKIISAWRYPGVSKPGEDIPIPREIREELLNGE